MASSGYSSDATFFVESDEPGFQRMSLRDAAKMIARNKQEMIANELSRLACDEYLEDIMKHIHQMEVGNIKAAFLSQLFADKLNRRRLSQMRT
jgi:hypothetical protein